MAAVLSPSLSPSIVRQACAPPRVAASVLCRDPRSFPASQVPASVGERNVNHEEALSLWVTTPRRNTQKHVVQCCGGTSHGGFSRPASLPAPCTSSRAPPRSQFPRFPARVARHEILNATELGGFENRKFLAPCVSLCVGGTWPGFTELLYRQLPSEPLHIPGTLGQAH